MDATALALIARFRTTGEQQLTTLRQIVESHYDDVDEGDIVDSLDELTDSLRQPLVAAQANAQTLAAAFYRAMSLAQLGRALEPLPLLSLAGTRVDGSDLVDGMKAIGPMMLAQISEGRILSDVMDFGRYALTRYADVEVRGAADRESSNQEARPEIVGWEGIVAPGACTLCQGNSGQHDLDEPIYRHGNCNCDKVPVMSGQ